MGLSEAMLFAFAATIICAFAIAEKIIDIDFEQFMPKNLKKAKMKRILAKRETPLQGARLQKDIKDSFENVLLPLGKADKGYLPKRMDLTFRRKMVHQVELLGKRKLCRDIQVTDVVPLPKNNFKRWNDDGREWRESILQCSSLERLISPQSGKTVHQIYRKNSYLRILQSRHIRHSDRQGRNKEFYSDKEKINCPSCGAEVELSSQQVICPYCGGVIQSEFYDWQTEVFEIYEKMGANMQCGLLLLAYSGVMFLCLTLCLHLIKDTDVSLTKQDFHLQMGSLGLQIGFSAYYLPACRLPMYEIMKTDCELLAICNQTKYNEEKRGGDIYGKNSKCICTC